MYSQFWTTTWSTTTESACFGPNGFSHIQKGQVILGEIIHWKFPKEEHYGTPEQCLSWCSATPGCGAFLYYPTYRYCEYKYASDTGNAQLKLTLGRLLGIFYCALFRF